ncbi:MAG: AAA family ATPase [Lachnospiraceae bacterium]
MELKRDIYEELVKWKKEDSGHVLELRGARQVGKTYILDKFARENYNLYFYINMVETTGREFLECLDKATEWEPGTPRKEQPLHEAFRLFDERFRDDKNTVIIIDEIQESARVYSLIRQLAREFDCHFVVTGSYLGKILSREYFQPMGDLDILTLYSLSFEEFIEGILNREVLNKLDLYGDSPHEEYDRAKGCYDIYCQIGGYPSVVNKYVETNSIVDAQNEIERIIRVFIDESEHYFKNVIEMNVFEQVFPAIAQTMVREKKGMDDLTAELSKIIYKEDSSRITKKNVNSAISWLYRSQVIGFCGQSNECSPIDISMNRRFYFLDLGVCRYFLDVSGADTATVRGIVNENFVYIELLKRTLERKLAWMTPMFGTYKSGEIDFFVRNRENERNYGVEVKAGRAIGKTAKQLLTDNKVDAVYFLKGDTYGGMEGRMLTVPIYLAGRVQYDYQRSDESKKM